MKIKDQITMMELSKPLEELRTPYTEDSYFIERLEDSEKICWYGIEQNWIFSKSSNGWTNQRYEPCECPEYEKLYSKIKDVKIENH